MCQECEKKTEKTKLFDKPVHRHYNGKSYHQWLIKGDARHPLISPNGKKEFDEVSQYTGT